MKVLRHSYKTVQPLVSIFSCPAVHCFAATLAESLVPKNRSLLANFSTWANDRDVFQHVKEDIGAAVGGGGVVVTHVHSVAVAFAPHLVRKCNLGHPEYICDAKISETKYKHNFRNL